MINEAYPNSKDALVTELVDLIASFDDTPSPAVLECYMLRHRLSVEDAIQNIEELKDMAKENAEKETAKRLPALEDDDPASLEKTTGECKKDHDSCDNFTEESTEMQVLEEHIENTISQSCPTSSNECSKTLDESDDKLCNEGKDGVFDANMENKIDKSLLNSVNLHHANVSDTIGGTSKQEEHHNSEETAKK